MNHHPKSQSQINLTQGLVIGGKYRLEQQIGFGGMNSVI